MLFVTGVLYLIFIFRVGGSIPVIFSYFTEFQPKDKRGRMISALATFWMFGNIIAAGKKNTNSIRGHTLIKKKIKYCRLTVKLQILS